jgi:hypothetical protein
MTGPIDPELAALFRSTAVPEPPEGALGRVRLRLGAALVAANSEIESPLRPAGPSAAALGASKGMSALLATFVAGAVVGAGSMAIVRPAPPPPRIVYVQAPPAAEMPSIPPIARSEAPPVEGPALPPAAPTPPARALRSEPRAAQVTSARDALAAERSLLDSARSKLAAGEPDEALAALDKHARSFPQAVLAEEREALRVQAFVNAGRYDEARALADAFRARVPTSVYLPAIDATLASIP